MDRRSEEIKVWEGGIRMLRWAMGDGAMERCADVVKRGPSDLREIDDLDLIDGGDPSEGGSSVGDLRCTYGCRIFGERTTEI